MKRHREVRGIDASMPGREVEALLKNQPLIRLATASRNADPHASTLWFVYSDNFIYFSADEKTKKIRNIKLNTKVSLVVDSGHELFKVKGIMINGLANIVADEKTVRRIRTLFAEKYFGSVDSPEFARLDFYMKKQVFVRIKPTKIVSWDYTKWDKK